MKAIFIVSLFFLSCQLSVGEPEDPPFRESVPDIVAYDLNVVDVKKNGEKRELSAAKVTIFEEEKRTLFYKVSYVETKNDEPVANGSITFAELSDDQNLIELRSGFDFYSNEEETRIKAESLTFNRDEKALRTPPEREVRIRKDSGTTLIGRGFQGDIQRNQYSFYQTEGILVDENDSKDSDGEKGTSLKSSTLFEKLSPSQKPNNPSVKRSLSDEKNEITLPPASDLSKWEREKEPTLTEKNSKDGVQTFDERENERRQREESKSAESTPKPTSQSTPKPTSQATPLPTSPPRPSEPLPPPPPPAVLDPSEK